MNTASTIRHHDTPVVASICGPDRGRNLLDALQNKREQLGTLYRNRLTLLIVGGELSGPTLEEAHRMLHQSRH